MSTLAKIANETGLSRATVSNILNGRNKENWASTVKRGEEVREVARRLGYQPNSAAIATKTGRYGCVALLLSTKPFCSTLPQEVWRGIGDELARHNNHLALFQLPDEELTDEARLPKILREWMADGMLIDYTHLIPSRLIELLRAHHLPVVWLNSKQTENCVYPDDFGAGQDAARRLLELGHRNLAYFDMSDATLRVRGQPHYSVFDRQSGFESVVRAAVLEPQIWTHDVPKKSRVEWLKTQLEGANRPSAVACYGLEDAQFVQMAATQNGLELPRDLSILTFGGAPEQSLGLDLATLVIPHFQLGLAAARMLLARIENPDRPMEPQVLPFEWKKGASLAPFKK